MSLEETTVEGTLKSDGTLELDQKPDLLPGRVQVLLRHLPESASGQETWWQYLQRARQELECAGHRFMNDEELAAHIDWLREGDAIDEMLRQTDVGKNHEGFP